MHAGPQPRAPCPTSLEQVQKEVELEHFGHAAFDPSLAHEDDIAAEDLGYRAAEVLRGGGRAKVLARIKEVGAGAGLS